jgi:flagellar basal body-associated protein FliL
MADQNPDESAAKPEAKPAQGGGMAATLISSLVVALILGGVGFALAYFVLPSRLQQTAAATPAGATAPAPAPAAAGDSSKAVATEKTERSAAETAAQGGKVVTKFTIEEVTVNIADTRGNRFVRAGVYFEAAPPVLEELEANRARMVDTLGQVLSTKTLDDLTSPNIRGNLREELLGIINPTLKAGRVDNVYFTDLLVQ